MNDFLRLSIIVVFVDVTLVALFVVVGALFPKRVGRARVIADSFPGRSLVVGLINLAFWLGLALAFGALGQWLKFQLFNVPALILLVGLAASLTLGLAGVVQLVGERLAPSHNSFGHSAWGALAVTWACAAPFIGWFGLLPYAGLLGLGAFILSFFYPARPAEPAAER